MIENEITQLILKCAFEVHTTLGPGLFENVLFFHRVARRKLNTEEGGGTQS